MNEKLEQGNEMGRGIERQAGGGKMRETTNTEGPLKRHENLLLQECPKSYAHME